MQHLDDVPPPGPPHVGRLLRLPGDDAGSQEQEEAREEDGEEDEEIDVQLVLAEEYHAVGGAAVAVGRGRLDGAQGYVELGLAELVLVLGQGEDQPSREVAHEEEAVALADGDEGREAVGRALHHRVLDARVPLGLGAVGHEVVRAVRVEVDLAVVAALRALLVQPLDFRVLAPLELLVELDLGTSTGLLLRE